MLVGIVVINKNKVVARTSPQQGDAIGNESHDVGKACGVEHRDDGIAPLTTLTLDGSNRGDAREIE